MKEEVSFRLAAFGVETRFAWLTVGIVGDLGLEFKPNRSLISITLWRKALETLRGEYTALGTTCSLSINKWITLREKIGKDEKGLLNLSSFLREKNHENSMNLQWFNGNNRDSWVWIFAVIRWFWETFLKTTSRFLFMKNNLSTVFLVSSTICL